MKRIIKILIVVVLIALIGVFALNFQYNFNKVRSMIIRSAIDDVPGEAPEDTYPLVLFHGFNPLYSKRISELSLAGMQTRLAKDLDYVNKEVWTSKTTCAELRYSENPIIIRATYYNKFEIGEIEEYSQKVDKIITKIKYCTGAEKVDIITHSMGGIVVRNYIKNIDDESVRKLIMIATPNHGGLYNIGEISDYIVKQDEIKLSGDFLELSENHEFMQTLNQGDETPGEIEYYTIIGNADGKGDGLIKAESVHLEGEKDTITVPCRHFFMKYPSGCPESYEFIKGVIV